MADGYLILVKYQRAEGVEGGALKEKWLAHIPEKAHALAAVAAASGAELSAINVETGIQHKRLLELGILEGEVNSVDDNFS